MRGNNYPVVLIKGSSGLRSELITGGSVGGRAGEQDIEYLGPQVVVLTMVDLMT